jgi:hypothetical protein
VSGAGPEQKYLEAVGKELRVGRRYRQRVLAELASHIEDAAEREQQLGLSSREAQRRAIERVGAPETVAEHFSFARRVARASAPKRRVRLMGYLGACLVVACAALAPLGAPDSSDGHLGLEVSATLAAALAVLLLDTSSWGAKRGAAVLAGVACVWIAAVVILVRDGDVLFCAQVFGGVLLAAMLLSATRRLSLRAHREDL